jgi:hypothetical protein
VGQQSHLQRMGDVERRIEGERIRIEAEYRPLLKSSVQFEKKIRDRWREKCLAKNQRIAELEERVLDLGAGAEPRGRTLDHGLLFGEVR